ncbi:MAG: hypothetical protein PHV12_01345 [Bacteroidales bacterium]|jgi:hypothetical protein|nr:hypothetical protein [Bacteroidales bacterium]MDD3272527.1 hypothetical protein [Bacteroidales bacterium]MDD4057722.1 hypothetical protein [Bacteroidales bacterium]
MEGFITFIFVVVLVIFLLTRFLPLLLAWWVKRKFSKLSGNSDVFGREANRGGKKIREEDGTIVSDDVKRDKIVDSDIGEYVDYEESKKQ